MTVPATQAGAHGEAIQATDGELLMRFVRQRDRAALGEIVRKHAPMVMAVCRQVLGSRPDADDAFQATFLILVRRASSIERKSSVAGWLYKVAHRTSRRLAAKRRKDLPQPIPDQPASEPEVFSIIQQRELQRTLHDELARLPARYREPIVLFYFAGMSREEIAEELECTEAAVKGRLVRGRKTLRLALARRGVGLSVAVGACVVSQSAAAAIPALSEKTVLACASLLERGARLSHGSSRAVQLANEGVRTMMISSFAKLVAIPAVIAVAIAAVAQLPEEDARVGQLRAGADRTLLDLGSAPMQAAAVADPLDAASAPLATTVPAAGAAAPAASPTSPADPFVAATAEPASLPSQPATAVAAELDAAVLQALEQYYESKAKASELRGQAKRFEEKAYRVAANERDRSLLHSKQLLARADMVELEAEATLYQTRASNLRRQREQRKAAESATMPGVESVQHETNAKLSPGDTIRIQMVIDDQPREYTIERRGTVALGPTFGRVDIAGLSLDEAEAAIKEHLKPILKDPQAQVTRAHRGAGESQLDALRAEIRTLRAEIDELRGTR